MKRLKLQIQRWRDAGRRCLGRWLFDRPLATASGCQLQACRRILLIRWDAKLGDAIVSSFLFRELRKASSYLLCRHFCRRRKRRLNREPIRS